MNKETLRAKERIEKLKKAIDKYRYAYHVLDKSLISDAALDSLKKELFDLEQKHPEFITSDSPTQRIGGEPLKEFKKVSHPTAMLSFNDAFSEEDMRDWMKRAENYLNTEIKSDFFAELKIDGLAIELIYKERILLTGSTRGDGGIGEDITQNLKTIEAIPLTLLNKEEVIENLEKLKLNHIASKLISSFPKELVVRGEVFLTKKEFERINRDFKKQGKQPYANPRNLAAGSIRQLNPKITASRKLDSFAYSLITDLGQKTHEQEHLILRAFGFKTNLHNRGLDSLEGVFDFHKKWQKEREALDYEIDGIVVIFNQNDIFKKLGVVGKAPRGAIAYKFSQKEATTQVLDIKVQIGRTGVLTPVAILKPVKVGGVTITHATLHNMDEIQRLGVKIYDTVIVGRAGDVIPDIGKVLKELRTGKEKEFKMPNKCPICGSKIEKSGVFYKCSNRNCFALTQRRLRHFTSKSAFDIPGVGPKIINRFLQEGPISDSPDLFLLKQEDISQLERFGDLSAKNIIKRIESAKNVFLPKFIYSLSIGQVGEETANIIANFLTNKGDIKKPLDILKYAKDISLDEWQKLYDVGPKVAESIYNWFNDNRNQEYIKKLDKVGILIKQEKKSRQPLKGLTFVFTGELEKYSRNEAQELVRKLGGHPSSSISQETDYVVIGENPGSKYDKARKLGVKVLTEKQFGDLVKQK